MNIEGYDAFDDPYSYPGTTVLKNLLDIQDQGTPSAPGLDSETWESTTLRPVQNGCPIFADSRLLRIG